MTTPVLVLPDRLPLRLPDRLNLEQERAALHAARGFLPEPEWERCLRRHVERQLAEQAERFRQRPPRLPGVVVRGGVA